MNPTPLMKQYFAIKEQYPDALLLFQVGDFYELFFADAQTAAQCLGITLTARGKNSGEPIPLCGVPVHALSHYLPRLIKAGHRVALCEQLEEAVAGKVVDRGVTKVYTPGTLTDDNLLDEKSASYICALVHLKERAALLFAELLTAQLYATILSFDEKQIEAELLRFNPDEVLIEKPQTTNSFVAQLGYCLTVLPVNQDRSLITEWLQKQFKTEYVEQITGSPSLFASIQLLYYYLKKNNEAVLEQFRQIHFYNPGDFLLLDCSTQRNLEIIKNYQGASSDTLFETMDDAVTPMGSRAIKKWLLRPLIKREAIIQRQQVVQLFKQDFMRCQALRDLLRAVGDFERIVGRIAINRGMITDYLALLHLLSVVPEIKQQLARFAYAPLIQVITQSIADFSPLYNLLSCSLNTDANKDWTINEKFDHHLDHVRQLVDESNALILQLETQEIKATGITSLKIRYNQVHGYYIEITKPNLHLVPSSYIRHQTLVGKERYTTPELKKLESDIMMARREIDHLEEQLFQSVKQQVLGYINPLRRAAQALAHLDALLAFAHTAYHRNYACPEFNDQRTLSIKAGRHPVIEEKLKQAFICNDVQLSGSVPFWLITGPNMGGKSTFMRQVALICILAQCGSFVPAQSAQLPILERIFTRIGASDNLIQGKSTFFVEMEETAIICSSVSRNSLVILDEIGRGTSTFDGLAVAQSVAEFLSNVGAFCLFATHYHELTVLATRSATIANYHAASKKTGQTMLLLYKILPGVAQGSFGIEVAKMAGLPLQVIQRAEQLLRELGETNKPEQLPSSLTANVPDSMLQAENERMKSLIAELVRLDYDSLTPRDAFNLIWHLREKMEGCDV